jgi:(2Fe-2S) ferredoxin
MTGPESLEQIAERRIEARQSLECRVSVCSGLGCESVGGEAVLGKIRACLKEDGLAERSDVFPTCCRGLCQRGPIVEVQWTEDGKPRRHLYLDVDVEKAERIPMGRWLTQFGRRWPTALTPARAVIVVGRKPKP